MPITTEITTITPEIAEAMLEGNEDNRRFSRGNLAKLSLALRRGEWALNGEAIKVSETGSVLDGQHRLLASVNTGMPFDTVLITGLPAATRDTMDQGKSRTVADVLALNGYWNVNELAAIVSGIIQAEERGIFSAVSGKLSGSVTAQQVVGKLTREPSLVDVMRSVGTMKKFLTVRVAGILRYSFDQIDIDDSEDFFTKLRTGEGLRSGDPLLALRVSLLAMHDHRGYRGHRDPIRMSGVTIKAWNAYRDGATIERLSYRPGGVNPEPFPEPH